MKHKLINNDTQKTFAVILESGDEVMQCINAFANREKLAAAQFTAIGAFSEATIGFFDFSIKEYKKIEIKEQVEVLNLSGDVTFYNGKPKVHAHVILGKQDGTAHGGHLLKAITHPTLEIILNEAPSYLEREMDEESGLPLIKIN